MTWFVRAFIKASVAWLGFGVLLGLAMAIRPTWTVYRAGHAHVMLLGFVTMLICGLAYHVIPRFAGRPLHSARAAAWHFWIANAGVVVMATGFACRDSGLAFGTWVLSAGGVLSGAGAYIFIWQIWSTLDAPRAPAPVPSSGRSHLPTVTPPQES